MKITSTIAANSMRTSYKRLNVVTNNIANASTNAFKKRFTSVENGTLYGPSFNQDYGIENQKLPPNIGANLSSINIDFSQGSIVNSGNPTDFAIEGNGFFGVIDPDTNELILTRNGEFTLFEDGIYRDRFGRELITDPSLNANPELQFVLYSVDPDKLEPIGNNFYSVKDDAVITNNVDDPQLFDRIIQYSLEVSNVNLADEFVSLMELQNIHSMSSKIFQIDDAIVDSLNNLET